MIFSSFDECLQWCNFISHFRGTSGIDIDLRKVDINQCPTSLQEGDDQIEKSSTNKINIFGGTDKCKPETTKVYIYS